LDERADEFIVNDERHESIRGRTGAMMQYTYSADPLNLKDAFKTGPANLKVESCQVPLNARFGNGFAKHELQDCPSDHLSAGE